MTNTRSHERLRLDYDLGKCFAKKRVQSHSSMNSYTSLRRNSVSSTELVPGGGLSTVMFPRENKASQRRRELSEDLLVVCFNPLVFLTTWGRQNSFGFISSMLSCPLRPTHSASRLPYIYYYESFHLVFCFPFRLCPGTGASVILSTCPSSLLLTCPYRFSLFSAIFFATDATFTDHLACSRLILSVSVTPHTLS